MKKQRFSPAKGLISLFFTFIVGLPGLMPSAALATPGSGAADPYAAAPDMLTNEIGMTFIKVLPGTFIMGSPVTEPFRNQDEHQHSVTITGAFYLQETEVTLMQWRAVMGKQWFARRKGCEKTPVTRVSWHDCMKYIKKLNRVSQHTYRLPTEEEWEYACRAGSATAYSWGEEIDCKKAVFGNNAQRAGDCMPFYATMNIPPNSPGPVRLFPPNAWGFYDMHGNVWEWCADVYSEYFAGPRPSTYSTMDADSRVRRGGSWFKHAHYLRSANRTYGHPSAKFRTTGFRLVVEAAE